MNERLKFKLFSFPHHYILVSWQNLSFFQAARATRGVARIFKNLNVESPALGGASLVIIVLYLFWEVHNL